MADPYVGEIRMFAGGFPPAGWMFCEGQLMSISENAMLYTLIGTSYGGDGQSTFALPDLRGRLPLHQGDGFTLAETGGVEEVTLTVPQIPAHAHPALASGAPGTADHGGGRLLAVSPSDDHYRADTIADTALDAQSVASVGGSQPHPNMQPYLCVSFIIAVSGIHPSPA